MIDSCKSTLSFEVGLLRISLKLCLGLVILFFSTAISAQLKGQTHSESAVAASNSSSLAGSENEIQIEAGPQLPKPGQPGSPFSVDHFWKRISFEVAGGYSPVLNRGTGYYGPGFTASAGAVERFSKYWRLQAEGQVLGQHGNLSHATYDPGNNFVAADVASYIFAFHLDALYDLRPDAANSPYLIGGAGYYHLGTHSVCATDLNGCQSGSNEPFATDVASVNSAGFNFGAGIRHRLYADRHTEIFADARYHFIASGSSVIGQVSVLPVSAGLRW